MLDQMLTLFRSAFYFRGLRWVFIPVSIGVAVTFSGIWLLGYWPPLGKRWLWAIALMSAVVTWSAIAFIQVPLQNWTGRGLLLIWDPPTLRHWILLSGIPQVFTSGLVQEGAKMAPLALYMLGKRFTSPKEGLVAGAMAGAGFGVFEAIWVLNTIFASGWTWRAVTVSGFAGLLGFWERFFTVGFHIAASAIAGFGLARERGWQFYLIAATLHCGANYSVLLMRSGALNATQTELYIAAIAVAATVIALVLRWKKEPDHLVSQTSRV